MPLTDSNATNAGDNRIEEWRSRLIGKKLSDTETTQTVFCKRDLPQDTRIIAPDSAITMDFVENRLNVYVEENDIVSHVTYG